jgi:Zn-dependent protease with chaperone function
VKWINIIGLCLQFVAFWLAAPELLGESTLKRFEKGLEKLVSSIPLILLLLVMLVYGSYFFYNAIIGISEGQNTGLEEHEIISYFVQLVLFSIFYLVFVMLYKRISKWLMTHVSEPLIHKLINNNESRKNALIVGAIVFSLGFFLQLTAAIFS